MTVLLRSGILRLSVGAAGVFALAGASELDAQRTTVRECKAPSTMVIAYPKAPDKSGGQHRDKLWSTFNDFKGGHFCLVPTSQVNELLTNSQFPIDTILGPVELAGLAQPLRADEVLQFEVVPVGRSVQLNGRIILARDKQGYLRDSIPAHEAGDISLVYKNFLQEVKKVQAMIELEKQCFQFARDEKLAEAEAAGRKALAAMPSSSIARMCLAGALKEAHKNPDEVIKLTDEVLAKDPTNMLVLQTQLYAHLDSKDTTRYTTVGGRIIQLSPTHPLVEEIIANLAQWKKTELVVQLLERALKEDPENPNLRRTQFRIVLASDNLRLAQQLGEALAKLDTAVVDTAFVNRMVNAYARDSNFQKAAEWLARGTNKWPDNIPMAMALAQTLRQLGQGEQAIVEYKRVLKLNPQARQVRLYIVDIYNTAGQTDSAFAWARRAVDVGEDKAVVANLSVQIANRLLKAAQDTTGGRAQSADDFKKMIPYAAYADTLGDLTGRFLWGVAALSIAGPMLKAMQPPGVPTCPGLKEAREWMALANEKVLGGARAQPTVAPGVLNQINSLMDYIDGQMKAMRPPCAAN